LMLQGNNEGYWETMRVALCEVSYQP